MTTKEFSAVPHYNTFVQRLFNFIRKYRFEKMAAFWKMNHWME